MRVCARARARVCQFKREREMRVGVCMCACGCVEAVVWCMSVGVKADRMRIVIILVPRI